MIQVRAAWANAERLAQGLYATVSEGGLQRLAADGALTDVGINVAITERRSVFLIRKVTADKLLEAVGRRR
jgi:hypothetical protein